MALKLKVLGAWLFALHGVFAKTEEATCESRLEKVKSELQQVRQAGSMVNLVEESDGPSKVESDAPGKADWPSDQQEYVPPLVKYFHELRVWMKTMDYQLWLAAVILIFGVLNLTLSQAAFHTQLTIAFALTAAASARYEVALMWPDLNVVQQLIVAGEAAALAGWIVYQSFTGAKMILGLLSGLAISAFFDHYVHTENWPLNYSVAWYSAWAILGILSLTVLGKYTLTILTPILGGFLVSSCLGFYICAAAVQAETQKPLPNWMHVSGGPWINFAGALLGYEEPAGIFGSVEAPGFVVKEIDIDRVLGRLAWFVLFYISAKFQWKRARSGQEEVTCGFRQPLLGNKAKSKVTGV